MGLKDQIIKFLGRKIYFNIIHKKAHYIYKIIYYLEKNIIYYRKKKKDIIQKSEFI